MGNCKYCGGKAGFLRGKHKECDATHKTGRAQLLALVEKAAGEPDFNESALRANLSAIADGVYVDDVGIDAVIAEGWRNSVKSALADGILTQDEETRLREFRDEFAIAETRKSNAAVAQLDRAARDRLMQEARRAAIAPAADDDHLAELETALHESELSESERRQVLAQAWEAAVEGSLEDGVLSLDEENALSRYLDHFNLSQSDVDRNGAHHSMIQSAVIREAAEGIIPNRLGNIGRVPFNLMKSEQLVWVIDRVDYYEVKTRRERRGSSHGASIRVAKGLYYRPSTFRSRPVEWEETVHADTGMLGITSKHIYFHGPRKRFRIRYDRIVSFEPYKDGVGVMRDAQTAKPQSFKTGDGWFAYNLITNLAQHW